MSEYDELLRELDENPCPHCQGRGWHSVQERSTGDEMQEQCDCHPPRAAAAIRKLREEREALRADFERYAGHPKVCPKQIQPWTECMCGLDATHERWSKH